MATVSTFFLSPNTVLSLVGFLHGPDKTVPNPAEDWREATVNVVIPALNEEANIALCLSSIAKQTKKPQKIILVDDGSNDRTVEFAEKFSQLNGLDVLIIQRDHPIGKTPTIKRQAREFEADVEFILDGDTVLESDNYIERVVEELYKGKGIASACGTILPLRDRDRNHLLDNTASLQKFMAEAPDAPMFPKVNWEHHIQRGISNLYREVLYMLLQRFIYRGQLTFFGSILNPVGCAVAYRRSYVKNLFDKYEPILGDNLTNSEDIFIGFAMLDQGFRNIQLDDVIARSQEPEASRLPHQLYMWSSSFLQTCYYFDGLMRSPFKAFKRFRKERSIPQDILDKRKIHEQYRQPFGDAYTREYGRPIGWVMFMSALEKIFFPVIVIVMLLLQRWEPLGITLAVESVVALIALAISAKGYRLEFLLKGIALTPVRYLVILFDFVTMLRFAADIWIFKNKRWRK
ncbi:Glycosyltransferase, catalytic subunit of cellulose synthase and poly-beta-1,6-N-acetylglucosamine synthase [Formivibrio citricus]|uniref:Glycosyltransferase, catalytic subunit of cellulose synthase and poly-beta-1,6-N-acetylglucosamine synthase n=1 Tax=Formivibrio citricus TaxID=83765 RepID=A0A1I5CFD7_9NEIS|nr:glycosyltransferase [Formivibrio citricus]SFN85720.1 Glycosyltransferase, catalytic subunit of cellulose synthase and poly-beta-1,6-N-acetylglucosamine synthase [Formivibrio citricus]